MFALVATMERAGSLPDRLWGVFVLGLTLVTAALIVSLAVTALGFGSLPPGLVRARPWIAVLGVLTLAALLATYLGGR